MTLNGEAFTVHCRADRRCSSHEHASQFTSQEPLLIETDIALSIFDSIHVELVDEYRSQVSVAVALRFRGHLFRFGVLGGSIHVPQPDLDEA